MEGMATNGWEKTKNKIQLTDVIKERLIRGAVMTWIA
jgi:hypothetical protein